jgi:cell filamentation protein
VQQNAFIDEVTIFLSELNAIHPFREGNGRTQLTFTGLIGQSYGHRFPFERLKRDQFSQP